MIFPTSALRSHSPLHSPPQPAYRSEQEIVRWWFAKGMCRLSTTDDVSIYVFHAGSLNHHDGPDIRGATLFIGSELMTGDVECHLRERSWSDHGHHRDPRYENVILHIVLESGSERAETSKGRPVPAVVAKLRPPEAETLSVFCQLREPEDEDVIRERLKPLAYGRWIRKAADMRAAILNTGSQAEAFYRESFRALGLKGNESSFAVLSSKVSLQQLRRCKSVAEIESVLMVRAGLCNDAKLQKSWSGIRPVIAREAWNRKGIRPAARPEVRLPFGAVIASHLLAGWRPWCDGSTPDMKGLLRRFGDSLPGRGWCGEWLGNVILPFRSAATLLEEGSDAPLFEMWSHINLNYSYEQLRRHFSHYFPRRVLTSFGVQQGLLALRKRYCSSGLCKFCPLKR